MSRFLPPEIKILKISQGDTLTVRRRLNAGETREALAQMSIQDGDGLRVNRLQVGLAAVVAYLLDWSLVDDDGKLVVIRDQPREAVIATLDALDTESYEEIRDAIQAHDVAARQESEALKNARAGSNGSPAISPLPAVATGDITGSPSLTHSSMTSSSTS